jgi:hypothetical protein
MKTLAGILLFVLMVVAANSQTTVPPSPPLPPVAPKVMIETSVMAEKIVKGAPFSAEAVNESVQVLSDGNRIVRSSTNKLYRNSEGRFRREMSGGSGGPFGSFYSVGPGITILDPVGGHRYLLDSRLMTARVGSLGGFGLATTVTGVVGPGRAAQAPLPAERLREIERVQVELRASAPAAALASNEKAYADAAKAYANTAKVYAETLTAAQGAPFAYSMGVNSKYESRTEELGVQNIEGVEATGTRTITTIPAGDIGNERPIEIVYEKWYSKELQLVVMSKHSDPRFGDQTYRLTNIVRSEPDPSLFELPSGYRVLSEPAGSFTISSPKTQGRNVVWTKASGTGTATSVKSTKP